MTQLSAAERLNPDRVTRWALLVGVALLAVCVVGAFFDPAQFFRSYLASYQFVLGIGLGCLAILMIYHVTGGAWGFLVRRYLEAGTRTLPLLALLMIPIGCGLGYLFAWARPEDVAADRNLQWKQIYLNVPFWWARAVLFFAVWLIFSFFLNRWSRLQDKTGDPDLARRLSALSGPGLVAYGITMHFAAVDWIMSLQTAYKSSIFGPLLASGQIVSAMALVLVMQAWLSPQAPRQEVVSSKALIDQGSLLFAFLIIWAYMAFFEFMLVWIANLRHEAIWFLDRSRGGWVWVNWTLVLLHFTVPFFLLLSRAVKRNVRILGSVAGLVLVMHLVFLDWQVLPAFGTTSIAEHWMDFLMPVGLGGLWFACYLWELRRRPLLPAHDDNEAHVRRLFQEDREQAQRKAMVAHG